MELRRPSPRESRRRRVLVDELVKSASPQGARNPKRSAPRYQPEALQVVHQTLAQLIPQRPWTVTLWALLGCCAVVAVIDLHLCLRWGRVTLPSAALAPFDITRPDSLAGWLNNLFLLLATGYAVIIYSMRCHRMNDYRGTYRLWLYPIVLLSWASIDSVAGLSPAMFRLCSWLDQSQQLARAEDWFLIGVPLILAIPACRIFWDLRETRGLLLLTAMAVAGSLASTTLYHLPRAAAWQNLWWVGCASGKLAAHFLLALAAACTARHMYLDASDQLTASRRARRTTTTAWPSFLAPLAARCPRIRLRWPWGRRVAIAPETADAGAAAVRPTKGDKKRLKVHSASEEGSPVKGTGSKTSGERPAASQVSSTAGNSTASPSAKAAAASGAPGAASASRPASPGSSAGSAGERSRGDERRVPPNSAAPGRQPPSTVKIPAPRPVDDDDDDDADDDEDSLLSRAERRRLKKEKRRQNRAA